MTATYVGLNPEKWNVQKRRGRWQVYEPLGFIPAASFRDWRAAIRYPSRTGHPAARIGTSPGERVYGLRSVTLTHPAAGVLNGLSYSRYPVDDPPVIDVPELGHRWYREVWERLGWSVTYG